MAYGERSLSEGVDSRAYRERSLSDTVESTACRERSLSERVESTAYRERSLSDTVESTAYRERSLSDTVESTAYRERSLSERVESTAYRERSLSERVESTAYRERSTDSRACYLMRQICPLNKSPSPTPHGCRHNYEYRKACGRGSDSFVRQSRRGGGLQKMEHYPQFKPMNVSSTLLIGSEARVTECIHTCKGGLRKGSELKKKKKKVNNQHQELGIRQGH